MIKYNPVIVVVAFSRPRMLERLLNSLKQAKNIDNADLIISIDNKEPENYNVRDIAQAFHWPFGKKEVRYQKERLGLRKHILQCGDLSQQYGSVIILEDDLFVSPYFYEYAVKALEFYGDDEKIGGISLYRQPCEETCDLPFNPVNDNSDVFFVQFPSHWGQAWTKEQWARFRRYYNEDPDPGIVPIPRKVLKWPQTSWKKFFCSFLVLTDTYFVFPRTSLTTNFNDPGTHLLQLVNHDGQVQVQLSEMEYRFKHLKDSDCIYDAHFEMLSHCVNRYTDQLKEYEFEMDLYGFKDLSLVKSPYMVTSRPAKKHIRSFKRALKPHELNVIFNLPGEDFFLCEKEDVLPIRNINEKKIADYKYYYSKHLLGWRAFIFNYWDRKFHKK